MDDEDMPRYIVADGEIYDHQIQRWPSKLEILETCNLPILDEDTIISTLLQLFNEDQIHELLCMCHSNDKLINIILEAIDNYDQL